MSEEKKADVPAVRMIWFSGFVLVSLKSGTPDFGAQGTGFPVVFWFCSGFVFVSRARPAGLAGNTGFVRVLFEGFVGWFCRLAELAD